MMNAKFLKITFIIFLLSSCKSPKRMDNIELTNGKFIKCKSLNRDEFVALRNKSTGGTINKIKKEFGVDAYNIDDGIIADDGGYYMFFSNLDDLESVLLDAKGASSGTEVLANKNYFGKDFPIYTNDLIKKLADTLNIYYNQVDESLIRKLDNKIEALPNSLEFKKKHLLNFIALIGEVLKSKYQLKWEMILSSDAHTWNPYMKSSSRQFEFFTYLYEDIYIKDTKGLLLTEIYETVNDIIQR